MIGINYHLRVFFPVYISELGHLKPYLQGDYGRGSEFERAAANTEGSRRLPSPLIIIIIIVFGDFIPWKSLNPVRCYISQLDEAQNILRSSR